MARQVAVYVAAVVALSGRYVDARTCTRSGAQLQAGYPGYSGDSGHPGLLPGGKTYCDVPNDAMQALCDSCPQACINVRPAPFPQRRLGACINIHRIYYCRARGFAPPADTRPLTCLRVAD
eukprot:COSAG01_NODE_4765_length_4756_cov_1.963925_1_plen_121_part_00